MKVRLAVAVACLFACPTIFAQHKLAKVTEPASELAEEIVSQLNTAGLRVEGDDGPVCDIWLAKSLPMKPNFSPTLSVKYPFTPGQLIGALHVRDESVFTDFRGQEIEEGVYTLRYGQQPVDGNHIGTSELADFLLALPADVDTSAKPITDFDTLAEHSAESGNSGHPAILSMLPATAGAKEPSLAEDDEFWVLSMIGNGRGKDGESPVPMSVIVIGHTDE